MPAQVIKISRRGERDLKVLAAVTTEDREVRSRMMEWMWPAAEGIDDRREVTAVEALDSLRAVM